MADTDYWPQSAHAEVARLERERNEARALLREMREDLASLWKLSPEGRAGFAETWLTKINVVLGTFDAS